MVSKNAGDVEKLLLEYMKIDSTSAKEGKFGDLLKEGLESKGWIVAKQPLDNDSSRFNLLATRKPLDEVSPRLIFNTHLDTVPPYIPPTEDEENIYGRGSSDAKAQMACMVSAAQTLVESHPNVADQVGLLFVVGEEVDHVGMQLKLRRVSMPSVEPLIHIVHSHVIILEKTTFINKSKLIVHPHTIVLLLKMQEMV